MLPLHWLQVSSLSSVLRHSEKLQMEQVVRRAQLLADYAQELGVRLLVDAEQTYFQPAIRHIAVNILMPKYNLDTPTIYSTMQCYLKASSHVLISAPRSTPKFHLIV